LRLPRHEDRIEKLHRIVNSLKVRREKQKELMENEREQLKKVIRTAAEQLIQYIFPLSKVQPNKRYYLFQASSHADFKIILVFIEDA